jgi:hypothetical protein
MQVPYETRAADSSSDLESGSWIATLHFSWKELLSFPHIKLHDMMLTLPHHGLERACDEHVNMPARCAVEASPLASIHGLYLL